jgi:polyisoprenoid-binding protein YceI
MKKVKVLAVAMLALSASTGLLIYGCSKEDSVEPLTSNPTTGSDVITITPTGAWALDKVHSNVMWETLYMGSNALLTGRFNNFDMKVDFKEADLANSSINAWVQLSTFNTGEPGRDGYGKCGPGYMGIKYDTIAKKPLPSTDTAWYKSTSIVRYGNQYLAKGNLIFRGVTKPTDLYFDYRGITSTTASDGKVTYRAGFSGHFKMLANTDFKVNSTSIADEVTVKMNCNAKKK